VHRVVGKNKFLNDMIRVVSPKFGLGVSQRVRIGLLAALMSWTVCAEGGWAMNVGPAVRTLAEAGVAVPPGYQMAKLEVDAGENFKDLADPLEGAQVFIALSVANASERSTGGGDSDLLDFGGGDTHVVGAKPVAAAAGLDDLLGLGSIVGTSPINPRAEPKFQTYEGESESAVYPGGPVRLGPPTFHEG
jgi:hypothetical protein